MFSPATQRRLQHSGLTAPNDCGISVLEMLIGYQAAQLHSRLLD